MSHIRHVLVLSAMVALSGAAAEGPIVAAVRAEPASLWEELVIRSQPRAAPAQAPETAAERRRTAGDVSAEPGRSAELPLKAPRVSRISIDAAGKTELEGFASPGSTIYIRVDGGAEARVKAADNGRWQLRLSGALAPGDHGIATTATQGNRKAFGDDVRISIPHGAGVAITVEDGRVAATGSLAREDGDAPVVTRETRQRAEALATEASKRFDEIAIDGSTPKDQPQRMAQAGTPAKAPPAPSDTGTPGALAPVYDWLEKAARGYQSGVVDKLAVPREGAAPPTPPAPPPKADAEPAGPNPVRSWLEKANETYQREVVDRLARPNESGATGGKDAPIAEQVPVLVPDAEKEAQRRRAEAKARADREAEAFMSEKERIDEQLRQLRARAAEEARAAAARATESEQARRRAAADAEIRAREAKAAEAAARARLEQEKKLADAKKLIDDRNARKEAEAKAKKAEAEKRASEERARAEALAAAAKEAEIDKLEEARLEREAAARRRQQDAERVAAEAARREASKAARVAEAERARAERARQAGALRETQEEAAAEAEREVQKGQSAVEAEDAPPVIVLEDDGGREEARPAPQAKSVRAAKPRRVSVARTKGWRQRATALRNCKARCRRGRVHVVRPGETLWAIANRYYCTGSRYETIYRANRRMLSDPDVIRPWVRLYIPKRGC